MAKKPKYFDIQKVIDDYPETTAYVVVGQRGAGKSYSIKKYLLKHFGETGKKFIYLRRWTTDIQGGRLKTVFDDVITKEKEELTELLPQVKDYDDWGILPRSSFFYVVGYKKDSKKINYLYEIGRVTCISDAEKFKGGTYLDYDSIFFDEFISERAYVYGEREPEHFNKIMFTVARSENDKVKIFLAGNPDNQIEMCPYLYDMSLDYANMEANTIFTYNMIDMDGVEHVNTKIFIKLASLGSDYLNLSTWGLWGRTSEDMMSINGEVKTNHYIHLTDEMSNDFESMFCMEIETAIKREEGYFKHIYAYLGTLWNEPMIIVENHKRKTLDLPTVFCRYDPTIFTKRKERQIFRLAIPSIPEYNVIRDMISWCMTLRNIATRDDGSATIFETILGNSKI